MWPFRTGKRRDDADVGSRGEALARSFLKKQGLKILAENYRCASGEIDLIALDSRDNAADVLAFVEVKTRTSAEHSQPEAAVHRRKKKRIRSAAAHYLARHAAQDLDIRYDIVTVLLDQDPPRINHMTGAF
ncbi:MAG: YraN family protein [Phycisphaerae bacterium]